MVVLRNGDLSALDIVFYNRHTRLRCGRLLEEDVAADLIVDFGTQCADGALVDFRLLRLLILSFDLIGMISQRQNAAVHSPVSHLIGE